MRFLGCDGGSTKFTYVIVDERGQILAHRVCPGLNTIAMGEAPFYRALAGQLRGVLEDAGITSGELTYAVFGVTGYGESRDSVREAARMAAEALGHDRFTFVNDAVVGWSGALMGRPGVCVASGTGSVAYGEDGRGGQGRAGGWSLLYGDEGSAFWVAKRAINVFFRQADGRLPRTALYGHFMDFFALEDPLHLPMELERYTKGEVSALAGLQREVLALYQAGEPYAEEIYREAGEALAQLVEALQRRLEFPAGEPLSVAYTGGLFRAGACVVEPFERAVRSLGGAARAPLYGPEVGAVCYAARGFLDPEALGCLYEAVDAALRARAAKGGTR